VGSYPGRDVLGGRVQAERPADRIEYSEVALKGRIRRQLDSGRDKGGATGNEIPPFRRMGFNGENVEQETGRYDEGQCYDPAFTHVISICR
jgi:hypothetical protein